MHKALIYKLDQTCAIYLFNRWNIKIQRCVFHNLIRIKKFLNFLFGKWTSTLLKVPNKVIKIIRYVLMMQLMPLRHSSLLCNWSIQSRAY